MDSLSFLKKGHAIKPFELDLFAPRLDPYPPPRAQQQQRQRPRFHRLHSQPRSCHRSHPRSRHHSILYPAPPPPRQSMVIIECISFIQPLPPHPSLP